MEHYFATGQGKHLEVLIEEKVKAILISYAYCKKGIPDNLIKASQKQGTKIMLDSGGFTLIKKGHAHIKMEEYLEFLDEYGKVVDEYIQLDDPKYRPRTLKNFKHMIEKGYKPLYVDHLRYRWIPELKEIYKNSKYCWGAIPLRATPAVYKRVADRYKEVCEKPSSKVHLLAFGQRIRRLLPWFDIVDSFDSATWAIGSGSFGKWLVFYPASEDKPYPFFKQHEPPWKGTKPPKVVYEKLEQYKLNAYKYYDRLRLAVRELVKYYQAMEDFHAKNKSKGFEFLHNVAVSKSVDEPYDESKEWPLQVYIRRDIEKRDAFMSVPAEDKGPFKFSIHEHWKGKSVHADLRLEQDPGKLLVGWKLDTQLPDSVQEPILTSAGAKKMSKECPVEYSLIDWNTGVWAERKKMETGKPAPVTILCRKKSTHPFKWLEAEGVTKTPNDGSPALGGDGKHPGVFNLVDKGTFEYGMQKEGFHEYFLNGSVLKCRLTVMKMRDSNEWILSKSGPYPLVLENDTIQKELMPPDGHSALPKAIRKQIPKKYQYWLSSGESAKLARFALVEAIQQDVVKLDFEKLYKEESSIYKAEVQFNMPVAKVDEEKRLVTGIVLEPNVVDAQNDTLKEDAIERAAHNFLANYNRETKMGVLHQMFGEIGVDLVESWIVPVELELGGVKIKPGTWLMTVHVRDNSLWRKIKNKEITGFSIGGIATVV